MSQLRLESQSYNHQSHSWPAPLQACGVYRRRYDPDDRILARQALRDPYFRELHEMKKEVCLEGDERPHDFAG